MSLGEAGILFFNYRIFLIKYEKMFFGENEYFKKGIELISSRGGIELFSK